jgi:shikimate kinase
VAHLVFVGLPGTGKTTLAHALADLRQSEALDTDDLLATSVGVSAAQYLREAGETTFRKSEVEALRVALDRGNDVVIATGGGIVCSSDARAALSDEHTLWLDCDDDVILARLGDVERPLLVERPAEALAQLRLERQEWYEQVSRARIDTAASIDEVLALIQIELERLPR